MEQEVMELRIPATETILAIYAEAQLLNPVNRQISVEAKAFVDCSSLWSYIDELLARKLRLRLGEEVKGSVIRFGSGVAEEFAYRPRHVTIRTNDGLVTISVKAVRGLSDALPEMRIWLRVENYVCSIA